MTYPDVGERLKLQYLECWRCGLIGINPLTVFADIDRRTIDGERNIVAWADLDYEAYEADKLWASDVLYGSTNSSATAARTGCSTSAAGLE